MRNCCAVAELTRGSSESRPAVSLLIRCSTVGLNSRNGRVTGSSPAADTFGVRCRALALSLRIRRRGGRLFWETRYGFAVLIRKREPGLAVLGDVKLRAILAGLIE